MSRLSVSTLSRRGTDTFQTLNDRDGMISGASKKQVEVIPSGGAERLQSQASLTVMQKVPLEVIEISSSEDEEPVKKRTPSATVKSSTKRKFPKARRIVESESESEGEFLASKKKVDSDQGTPGALAKPNPPKRNQAIIVPQLPLYDEDDETTDDVPLNPDAILVYNEPPSPKKPMRVNNGLSRLKTDIGGSASVPSTPTKTRARKDDIQSPEAESPTKTSPSKRKQRVNKKAEKEARLARLLEYAQSFFHELNALVFNNGIPTQTVLRWNNKLYTTAGKARYNKSRNEGKGHSEIELAPKILEDEGKSVQFERIRLTLAHEMCHLACWIIDGNLQESHGALFKSWGARVMKARPDITVKTTHNYEITHPYRWQCADCQLIYGRFSKSIKPDESRCGKCGDPNNTSKGILVALHKERVKKDLQTPVAKISRMAASKARDSPSAIFSRKAPVILEADSLSEDEVEVICDVSTATTADTCTPSADDSSDSEIEFIAIKMNTTTLDT